MEDLIHKLNKYSIKLQKFINNKELIEIYPEKFMIYAKKFKYYYKLAGGGPFTKTPEQKAAAAARKTAKDAEKKARKATKDTEDAAKQAAKDAEKKAKKDKEARAKTPEGREEARRAKAAKADEDAKDLELARDNYKYGIGKYRFGTRSVSGKENYIEKKSMKKKAKTDSRPEKYANKEQAKADKAGLGFIAGIAYDGQTAINRATNRAAKSGASSLGASSLGASSLGASSLGASSLGASSLGASSLGASSLGNEGNSLASIGDDGSGSSGSSQINPEALGDRSVTTQKVIQKLNELCTLAKNFN
jgi:hypothetical protein